MEDTVTTHVTPSVADALLERAGFTICVSPVGFVTYTKPGGTPRADGGKFGSDYLWDRDEALTEALVILAEALAEATV